MKIDPYNHKERYLAWKKANNSRIPGITAQNSEIIMNYLDDMEKGLNVASISVKGTRSYTRLNSLREKLVFFSKKFEEIYNISKITDITEEQLISFFADIKNGKIKRKDGKDYTSTATQGRIFKAFWHWHQKVSKKKGIEIPDITVDLDTRAEKPAWVYLNEREIKLMCDNSKPEYRMLMMFLFDTGIRSPGELINIKVSDLHNNFKELNIRDEISKTFGRRIKLMLCSDLLKEYVKNKGLRSEEYLFQLNHSKVNQYLKRLSRRLFGDKTTPAGAKYSDLTMYDFRHCSCCYWLPRYKSESALKYRFGWKKSDKIHYYSELLGMKDTISEEDMLIDITKTEIEKMLLKSEKEREILSERVKVLEKELLQLKKISLRLLEVSPIDNKNF